MTQTEATKIIDAVGEFSDRHKALLAQAFSAAVAAALAAERQRLAGIAEQAAMQTQGNPRKIYERVCKG